MRFVRTVRWAAVVAAPVLGALALVQPAWAHVTVHPGSLPAGSSDIELTFRVPNERDNANTLTVQVFFPTNLPLLTVDVLPVPGWTATVHTHDLTTPVQTDDGAVSQIVSDVAWNATGGGIAPGQYEDFSVAAGQLPRQPARLAFKALQTYSSGEIVRWIQVATAQDPNPDSPAPILTLTAGGTAAKPSGTPGSRPAGSSGGATTADILASIALALSVVSLAGVGILGARGRRTPVA